MRNRNIMSRDLTAILQKNGLDAEVVMGPDGTAVLNVKGDRGYASSPPVSYRLTPRQLDTLVNARGEGTGVRLKKAYETFNAIVAKDFMPPQSYSVAFNAGIDRTGRMNRLTPVNMGWNGSLERRSRNPYAPYHRTFQLPDGRLKPGEAAAMRQLPDGRYAPTAGYVWKGAARPVEQQMTAARQPVVVDIVPTAAPRPEDGKAVLLRDHVRTAGNDTFVMLDDILQSHGIVIKEGKDEKGEPEKQLVVMAKDAKVNIIYHLTEEEYRTLTADGWLSEGEKSLDRRLDIINSKASLDFREPITRDMLNTANYVDLSYKDGRREVNEARYIQYEERQRLRQQDERELKATQEWARETRQGIYDDPDAIDGRDVSSVLRGKAFYQDGGSHARQMTVGEIRVDSREDFLRREIEATVQVIERDRHRLEHPETIKDGDGITEMSRDDILQMLPEQIGREEERLEMLQKELKDKGSRRYTMTAEIDGERKTVAISEKDYNRFRDYDDQHRLKMFAEKFSVSIGRGRDDSWRIVRTGNGYATEGQLRIQDTVSASVNENILRQLGKGFYAEQRGGRQKDVTNIVAYDLRDPSLAPEDRERVIRELDIRDPRKDGHVIAADIDGRTVIRKMTDQQYREYMKSDDAMRLKIADRIFDEFKVKDRKNGRNNTGTGITAAQQSVEAFERITEYEALTEQTVGNGLHK